MKNSRTRDSQATATEVPQLTPLGDRHVLFVMAAEYGPHLRQRFTPLMTGVGPL